MRTPLAAALASCALLAACGSPSGGAGSGDAAPPARQAVEITGGAGRLTSGTVTMDAQVGRAVLPAKAASGTATAEPDTVVRP